MRKYYWILLFAVGLLSSCEKVKDLSDDASIERFEITSYTPTTAELGEIYRNDKSIIIPVVPEDNLFPLTLQTVLETSSTTHKVLGNYVKGQDIVFNGGESTINFFPYSRKWIRSSIFYQFGSNGYRSRYSTIQIRGF